MEMRKNYSAAVFSSVFAETNRLAISEDFVELLTVEQRTPTAAANGLAVVFFFLLEVTHNAGQ